MGTSGPFGGGKNDNPLLPSWLAGGDDGPPGPPPADPTSGDDGHDGPGDDGPDEGSAEIGAAIGAATGSGPRRYTSGRRAIGDYMRSGGGDGRARGRAARSFVRNAGGGVRKTTQRMASERAATTRFAGILASAGSSPGGIRQVARELHLGDVADGPVEGIYAAFVDVVCPPDGDLDDAHAREAYLEAVIEIMQRGFADVEQPSVETAREILGTFITNAVHVRIVNAIGNGIVTVPADIDEVKRIEQGLKEFVRGCVADALDEAGDTFPADDLAASVDDFYERAVGILDAKGDAEARGEADHDAGGHEE